MNILNRVLGIEDDEAKTEGPTPEERRSPAYARQQHVIGMQMRHGGNPATASAGQQRRALDRQFDHDQRKTRRKYRRNWYANRQARAVLRGQLAVVNNPVFHTTAMVDNTEQRLIEAYGSVDKAREHWASIQAAAR